MYLCTMRWLVFEIPELKLNQQTYMHSEPTKSHDVSKNNVKQNKPELSTRARGGLEVDPPKIESSIGSQRACPEGFLGSHSFASLR